MRKKGKIQDGSYSVMAGLVPAIPIVEALCPIDRDRRDEPGDDDGRREFCHCYADASKSHPDHLG
jgi:hypothetical protein